MSADNWRVCPQCKLRAESKLAKDRKDAEGRLEAAYGRVSAAEYLSMESEVAPMRGAVVELEDNFREDYEFWIDGIEQTWNFSYSGGCTDCGYAIKERDSKPLQLDRVPS